MLRIIFIAFSWLIICSCGDGAVPGDKFIYSEKYRALINPYKVGDTVSFENKLGHKYSIVITKNDSVILQDPQQSKTITFYYKPVEEEEVHEFIELEVFPKDGKQNCYIYFQNFTSWIDEKNDNFKTEPVVANGMTINKYYQLKNEFPVKDTHDVKTLYYTNEKGIIAYQDSVGNWWTLID